LLKPAPESPSSCRTTPLDSAIVARRAQSVDDVAQQGLLERSATGLRERALERVAGQLVYERALRRDHECRRARHGDALAEQAGDQHEEYAEQQNQMKQPAHPIEARAKCGQRAHSTPTSIVHESVPLKGTASSVALKTNPAKSNDDDRDQRHDQKGLRGQIDLADVLLKRWSR